MACATPMTVVRALRRPTKPPSSAPPGMKVAAVEGDPALEKLTTPADFDACRSNGSPAGWSAHRHRLRRPCLCRRRPGDARRHRGAPPARSCGTQRCRRRAPRHHRRAARRRRASATSASISRRPTRNGKAPRRAVPGHAAGLVARQGAIIDHVDCTVIAEEPRVGPHRAAMRIRIAEILGLSVDAGQHQGDDDRRPGFHRPPRRHRRAGGRQHPDGICDERESPARGTGQQGARSGRGQPRRRAPDRHGRKLHRRSRQRRPDRNSRLIGRVRSRLRDLFQRGQDQPSSRSPRMSSRRSARSASPPPGRWRAARLPHPKPTSRWRSPGSPGRGRHAVQTGRHGRLRPRRARRRSGRRSSPTRNCSMKRPRSGVRLQAALCALDLLMP